MSDSDKQQPLETLMANRRSKLERLRERGVDPYPTRFRVSASISDARDRWGARSTEELEAEQPRVRLAGRVRAIRGHGKLSFADLSDGAEHLQLYLRRDQIDDGSWAVLSEVDLGDFVGVDGRVFRTRAGELSVAVESLVMLAKSLRPLPDSYHGLTDREARARRRYLDLLANPESRRVFEVRSAVVRGVRRFLDSRGFLEVETPMMQPIPGGASARPFVTHHNTLGLDLYLRIAPELYLKRLLVGGFERVYEINRNFRNEGISTRHNPEFTMLEFYWAYADYELLMDFTEELITTLADEVAGSRTLEWNGRRINLERPWRRLTLREAVLAYSELTADDLAGRTSMEAAARRLGVERIEERSDGQLLAELYEVTAEPQMIDPTFITDFPRDISPFAKSRPDAAGTVERFELFVGGMELANAFTELNDPDEQRRRLEEQAAVGGGMVDDDYVLALEHGLPPTGGEGIGIDRLVMLFADQPSIRDVILFPLFRPREEGRVNVELHIARRYLIGLRRRTHVATVTLISLVGLALGVLALVVTLALLEGFQSGIRNELVARAAHARIAPAQGRRLEGADTLASDLHSSLPSVDLVRVVEGTGLVSSAEDAVPALVVGRSDAVVASVDQLLAAKLGVGVGDEVEVISPRHRLTPMGLLPVRMRLTVEQIRPAAPGAESGTIGLPLGAAQRLLWGEPAVEALELRDPGDPWHLAGRVRRALGDSAAGLRVEGLEELHRPLLVALALERVMIFVAVGLMLVVAALNLLSNVAMVAAEKRTDLAVLSGLGLPPSALRRLFVLIGLGIGASGAVLGALLGVAVATILDATGALPLPRGVFLASSVPFRVDPRMVFLVVALTLMLSAAVSWLPSRMVARREPAEGLRYE